jgi:hypothetical protein
VASRTIALIAPALALVLAGCGSHQQPAAKPNAGTSSSSSSAAAIASGGVKSLPCSQVGDITGQPKTQPPADLAVPDGAHVYESDGPFENTMSYFAASDGGPQDLAQRRDDAAAILVQNSYTLLATDQEAAEAEAQLDNGQHTVHIRVITLCEGKVQIRYTVS